ncbi:nucleotide-binding oligomerization domain-containing protein 2-like [Stylophora pistillata]|uniref:nucleotide-binding oligomerization domain-containing protein 2-like n=1 Tax=Stylophora pistillata TaxID=50429 RepID=UPI000C03DA5B|nr:nucleotide-binding oligomerization domain-containing protein 2-like [Stylophora pistillata]
MEEDEQERKNRGKVMFVTSSQETSMHNESKITDSIKKGCWENIRSDLQLLRTDVGKLSDKLDSLKGEEDKKMEVSMVSRFRLGLMRSFIHKCRYCTVIPGGAQSSSQSLTHGVVPQGSSPYTNTSGLCSKLCESTRELEDWSRTNHFKLNTEEKKSMFVTGSRLFTQIGGTGVNAMKIFTGNGDELNNTTSHKLLGVSFDQDLSFSGHVEQPYKITNDLSQMRSLIGNLRDKLDTLMVQRGETKREDGFDPTEMIDNIRQLYKAREGTMNLLPWCEHLNFSFGDFYTRLKVIYKEKTRGTATDRVVTMSKIFNAHEEREEPRVVLIEGKPGMGKTTYCKKVVFDWATQKLTTGNYFAKFLIVLLIKCREVRSHLWEAIDDQLLPRDVDSDQRRRFFDFIRKDQSKVLLVLDGLDEVSEGRLPTFTDIIQGRVLPNCRVVATARHEGGAKVRKYCNTLLEVEGFTNKDARSFINKYFKTRKDLAKKLMVQLRDNRKLRDMVANPLNCALFCLVWEEFNGVFPKSRSELYMNIVECVLRRYRTKKQLPENGKDLVELYESQLKHLGSIAFKGLLEDNLDFDEKELGEYKATDLPELGFLSVQPGGSKLRPTRRYGFLHKTFQEFFAALDLSCHLIKQEISTKSIAADRRYRDQLKEVLLFTFGILATRCKETAEKLVKSMATLLNLEDGDKEVADSMTVTLKCIYECKNDTNFDVKLARTLGCCLEIETIDVSQRKLQGVRAVLLTNVLTANTSVTELNLAGNHIGKAGAVALAECLKENTSLKELDLYFNHVGEAGAASLAECLKENTSLTVLCSSLNNIGEAGAAALAVCLKENSTLRELYSDIDDIGEAGAAALADCLKENTSLTVLYLSLNNIGNAGAAALADCLKENTSLTELYLSRNNIGEAGAAALAQCSKENTSLTELTLRGNDIDEAGAAALAQCLKENTSLAVLY